MKELKKTIGKRTLLFLSINSIMGTGIFFLPAIGAVYSGPASILSWMIMSVFAILISTYFAELISMYPSSGGIYEYSKQAIGNFGGFIIGWISWIIANITIAMIVIGSVSYIFPNLNNFFSLIIQLMIILFFNYISYRGIDFSSKVLLIFGLITISVLIVLIAPGLSFINVSNFSPFIISPMILVSLFFIAENFFGWESTCYLTEEVKNSRRVVPKTIVRATILISIISLLIVVVSLGSVDSNVFSIQKAPLTFLSGFFFGDNFKIFYSFLIFIPLIGTAASWIISSPRLLFAMARDKILPKKFTKIHEKYKTPKNAIKFQIIATSFIIIASFENYFHLLSALVPLVMIVYSVVMFSIVKLRYDKPFIKRPYVAPFGKSGPLLIILFNVILLFVWLINLENSFSILLMDILLILFGFPLYFLIKLRTDKNFIENFYDKISFIWDRFFPFWYTKKETNFVLNKINFKKQMKILDFGTGSGITTLQISKKLKKGKIISVDISKKQLEKAFHKIKINTKMSNVIFLKSEKFNFEPNTFDAIISVGCLEHFENPKKSIKKLIKTLKPKGEFSFLSFGKSFGIPAKEVFENWKSLKEFFLEIKIEPKIKIEHKKFTDYIYIWGKKPKNWK